MLSCSFTAKLTLCIWETSKRVLLQTVKTQMKCSIMLHFIWFYTVCKDLREKIQFVLENYNLTPLDKIMYNGLFQVYCIKPDGRIH